ncbi:MAG: hypothetical protein KBH93_05350 [Anaerolineae bacterium]|nr:hypothetical protein [Anaerolineae bacterium]
MAGEQQSVGVVEFVAGLIVGFVVSVPVVAWLSPRSGAETREALVQRGWLIRRRAGETVRGPLEQVQQQLEQIKGESLEDALAEGKAIAARRWPLARDSHQ